MTSRVILATWSDFNPTLGLSQLPHTRRGNTALQRVLRDSLREDVEFVSLDGEKHDVVLDLIEEHAKHADGLFLVYLSSHGLLPPDRGLVLATAETVDPNDHRRSLSAREALKSTAQSKATSKVLIVDSCFSGDVTGIMGDPPPPDDRRRGVFTLTSSSADEVSYAPPDAEYTSFTEKLIWVLSNGYPSKDDEWLTLSDVATLVRDAVTDEGRPQPRFSAPDGVELHPVFRNASFRPSRVRPRETDNSTFSPALTVLVVDDEPIDLGGYREALRDTFGSDVLVRTAQTPDEATAMVRLDHIDVAIVDLFLGEADSGELLRLLTRRSPNCSTLVVSAPTSTTQQEVPSRLADIFTHPPLATSFLLKGTEKDRIRLLVRTRLKTRARILERMSGAADLASAVVQRIRRRVPSLAAVEDVSLSNEVVACLAELFAPWLSGDGDSMIDRVGLTPLDEGRSSCVVYRVDPSFSSTLGPAAAPLVVKIGPRREIGQELKRFHEYVQLGIPQSRRTDLVSSWLGCNVGGVVYSLLGDQHSAESYTMKVGVNGDRAEVLKNLFDPDQKSWYNATGERVQLYQYYEQFGFTRERRADAISALVSSYEKIERSGGGSLGDLTKPHPDWLAMPTLNRSWPTTLVHGDMHLGNVVTYNEGRSVALIDYRNVGMGPRCLDFVTAELGLVLDAVPPPGPQVPLVAAVSELYQAIEHPSALAIEVPEWLRNAHRDVQIVRSLLRENFKTVTADEFYACLFVAALRRSMFKGAAVNDAEKRAHRLILVGVLCHSAAELSRLRSGAANQNGEAGWWASSDPEVPR